MPQWARKVYSNYAAGVMGRERETISIYMRLTCGAVCTGRSPRTATEEKWWLGRLDSNQDSGIQSPFRTVVAL